MSPRKMFIERFSKTVVPDELLGYIYDAMQMSSTHDPDHAAKLKELERRIDKLEYPNVSRREHR